MRREYGSGSVYQRADGRWIGSINAGYTRSGTRRRITISAKTEAQAKRKLRDKLRDLDQHGTPEAAERTTVKGYADTWLDRQQSRLRPSTHRNYASHLRHWIIPTIGHKQLAKLTPADVRAVDKAIRGEGRTSTTARVIQTVLTKMLRDAIADGHRVPERLLYLDSPARAVNDRDAIDPDHAKAILQAAADLADGSRWVAALLQGMRQGECLGLTWDCVDTTAGTIDVSWQLQALPYREKYRPATGLRVPDGYEYRQLDGSLCLVRPKTARGRRIIPMVPWMAAALTGWRQQAPASPHGLVWPRPDGRPQVAADDLAAWKALQDRAKARHGAGRHYHLHEARHTTATLLMSAGIDASVVTAILGHSSIVTSRGYMHANQEMARQALSAVADRLGLTDGPPHLLEQAGGIAHSDEE
ncbi:tyrosine-type recombinase/integrase [Nakamurella aerolata]|uniref:Site-specific integrase n=1 Tax=Nakamurella aerolata TaxID=1656892 RepID=A0A849AAB1_9ACTN|nr:site-specific integrase [Nakamurella aerolata]NNG36897.1 site-specific integrase [Nakamurella aerolata]